MFSFNNDSYPLYHVVIVRIISTICVSRNNESEHN